MFCKKNILAERLGKTVHVSPLRFKLLRLCKEFPVDNCECIEQWLIELANLRGYDVIFRDTPEVNLFNAPDNGILSDEELCVAFCQLQCLDYPQILRLAGQIISRGKINIQKLLFLAKKEKAELVLHALSTQSLKVDPNHKSWNTIHEHLKNQPETTEPIIHWTRLAEPVMSYGKCNAEKWVLVS